MHTSIVHQRSNKKQQIQNGVLVALSADARYCKLPYGEKNPGYTGWNTPEPAYTVNDVVDHDGNVGLLCGATGGNYAVIDIDAGLTKKRKLAPWLKGCAGVYREDAPDRYGYIVRVDGELPKSKKYHEHGIEILSTGNHKVIAGIHASGAAIRYNGKPVQTVTATQIAALVDAVIASAPKPKLAPRIELKVPSELARAVLQHDGIVYRFFRIWLLARHIDVDGRGWVDYKQLKKACRIFRVPSVHIDEGATDPTGQLFFEVRNNGTVSYASLASVGVALGCKSIGKPVLVDVHTLRRDRFKPMLYAVWISAGRDGCRTMTRKTIEKLTGLPETTQRRFEKLAGVQVTPNVGRAAAVFNPDTKALELADDPDTLHIPASDDGGRYPFRIAGDKEHLYFRVANSYATNPANFRRANLGRTRKANRLLKAGIKSVPVLQQVFFPEPDSTQVRSLVRGSCLRATPEYRPDMHRWIDNGEFVHRVNAAKLWNFSLWRPFEGALRGRKA